MGKESLQYVLCSETGFVLPTRLPGNCFLFLMNNVFLELHLLLLVQFIHKLYLCAMFITSDE